MVDISMSKKAEEDFLFAGRILRLATISKDGSPHVVPIWYLYENGKIYIHTEANSVKARNIQRNNSVAMCVDIGEFYYDLKNIILKGKAKILEDEDLATRIAEKIQVKYFGSCSHPQASEYLSKKANNVVIEIGPSKKRRSQDYSLLRKHS